MMFGLQQPAPIRRSLSIKANLSDAGITIPQDFVGYSVNTSSVINGLLTGSSTSLINLAKMVGSHGVFRIGGSDQDSNPAPALTQQIADDLAAFVSALGTGWTCIYGLDAQVNNSASAATQAGYLANSFGDKVSFQFGNEPFEGSPAPFTTSTYATMWNAYYSAVVAAVPGAKFMAPDDGQPSLVQAAVNGLTGGKDTLVCVTTHWYPGRYTGFGASDLISTVRGNIVTAIKSQGFFKNNEWCGSTPQRLTETNSVSGGGLEGVSDRLCSAIWYLNQAIVFAKYGFAGINTHNNFWWSNSAIVGATGLNTYGALLLQSDLTSFAPGAIFYGLYLFSRIQGQQILGAFTEGNANQTSIATLGAGGNANILVANNDTGNELVVTPDQTTEWTTATVLMLSGSGPYDANPTLGCASINIGGGWSGTTTSISSGDSVTIPACGAALISIQP